VNQSLENLIKLDKTQLNSAAAMFVKAFHDDPLTQ